ncbi:hypothetical protein [Paraliomyxa miuraensis]|uniref:hypothetical protein n=1 Tax=Paraliomyxa miuraensis TaxID=376150 RepID=UPI002250CC9F|nr:hypothetical protein [Paraliomyxa miuraensis]MCX4243887.1 hypothetical protein [Paraliomyxa miuraensis]
MLACSSCRRFVRDGATTCPFCGTGLSDARSPLGGFMGVILGVTLAACGTGDDKDDGASSSPTASDTSTSATGTASTTDETIQPLYGPVSDSGSTTNFPETTGPLYGPVSESSGGSSDESGATGSGSDTATDTGESSSGSESAGPLYGPATG